MWGMEEVLRLVEVSSVERGGVLRLAACPIRRDLESWVNAALCVVGCVVGLLPTS